jgi:hypothetical protein
MNELLVTIAGQPFKHLLYHLTLTYSNWGWGKIFSASSFSLRCRQDPGGNDPGTQNRAMETGALWKPGKTKVPFSTVTTALRLVQIETKHSRTKNKKRSLTLLTSLFSFTPA